MSILRGNSSLAAGCAMIAGMNTPAQPTPFTPCCKDLGRAMSFPAGRHFFVEDGALKLLVAKTPLQGGEAELENKIRFCPFCGRPTADLFAPPARS
jgi:hypothetical protein